jgi:cysteine desulfurase/selenocysteine lyase
VNITEERAATKGMPSVALNSANLVSPNLRDDFPILHQLVHGNRPLVFLDSAASTQRPRQVIDALRRLYEQDYANVHRGVYELSERCTQQYEEARGKVREFIGARSVSEIIFTSGTTASINLVARSWGDANVHAGDEIIVSMLEHHSNLLPWQQLAIRSGATLKYISLTEDGRLDLDVLDKALTDRTKIVAISFVSNVLGTINPVCEIIKRAQAAGAVVLVDAAQSVPHCATDVVKMEADFLAFSGHKMLGPTGVGVLYGRESLLEAMPPFMAGGSMVDRVYLTDFTPRELPAKFEAGTPPIASAIGLGAAIDYLNCVGLDAIARHEHELTTLAYNRLGEIDGVKILGPNLNNRAGLISFTVDQVHPHDIAGALDKVGIAVRASHHCAQPLHDLLGIVASIRASFYLYNSPEEVDFFTTSLIKAREDHLPKGRKRRSRMPD